MSLTERLAQHLESHFARSRRTPATTTVKPVQIRLHLAARYPFTAPMPVEEVFDDVATMLWEWCEHADHPAHFGLFRPGVDLAAVAADALVAAYDPNLATYDFAPAAHEIEHHVLAVVAERFGITDADWAAHFTSGGQEANHTAVAVALTWKFPQVAQDGLRSLTGQPVFYLSQEGHHSFEKVAHSTGLGRRALRWVPAGADLKMDVGMLADAIRRDRAAGDVPFMVVGTAGTTSAGVVDPLPEIADLAAREGLWFHADAAWGGAAALSDRLRPVLAGLERADSITCDAHKWFSVPTGAGMFFSRHRTAVEQAFTVDSAYVPPPRREGTTNPLATTLQWSRRLIGLKLFMTLAERGLPGLAARVERQTERGDELRALLVERGFRVLNTTPLPVVCFTCEAIDRGEAEPVAIVRHLLDHQVAWISKTLLRRETPALRACITHFGTELCDLKRLVDGVEAAVAACRRKVG